MSELQDIVAYLTWQLWRLPCMTMHMLLVIAFGIAWSVAGEAEEIAWAGNAVLQGVEDIGTFTCDCRDACFRALGGEVDGQGNATLPSEVP